MFEIRLIGERCVSCGDCVELCPQSGEEVDFPVLARDEGGGVAVREGGACIGCFTCVESCRAAAIVIVAPGAGFPPDVRLYPGRPLNRII